MVVWWCILFSLIAMVTLGIFLPEGIGGGLDNIPFLIVLLTILLAVLTVKLVRYIRIFRTAKRHLRQNGFVIKKCNLSPPFGKNGSYNIVASKDGLTVNICVLRITRAYLTYHFENINTVELYKSTRLAIKPSVRQANIISGHVQTQMVGTKLLNWKIAHNPNEVNILLFDKFPNMVTDSQNREGLGNGDKICGKVFVYNLSGFERKDF